MSSVPAIGRQLVDVSAILVLGLVYLVALSVGTAGAYLWGQLRALAGGLSTDTVEEEQRVAR
jgi:hypothetical protein